MGIDSQTGNTKGPLIGNNISNTWVINGPDSGTLNGAPFINFQLVGGTLDDSFEFRTGGRISLLIDGGLGTTDNLVSGDLTGAFPGAISITGPMSGTIDADTGDAVAATIFSNIQIIHGGIGDDTISFAGAVTFVGQVDGLAGTDTLDLGGLGGSRTVTLTALGATDGYDGNDLALNTGLVFTEGFKNIDSLIGSGAANTLVGPATNTFFLSTGLTLERFRIAMHTMRPQPRA